MLGYVIKGSSPQQGGRALDGCDSRLDKTGEKRHLSGAEWLKGYALSLCLIAECKLAGEIGNFEKFFKK